MSPTCVICSKTRRGGILRDWAGTFKGTVLSDAETRLGSCPGSGTQGNSCLGYRMVGRGTGPGHRCGCPHGASRWQGQEEAEANAAVVAWWLAVLPSPGLVGNTRLTLLENLRKSHRFCHGLRPRLAEGWHPEHLLHSAWPPSVCSPSRPVLVEVVLQRSMGERGSPQPHTEHGHQAAPTASQLTTEVRGPPRFPGEPHPKLSLISADWPGTAVSEPTSQDKAALSPVLSAWHLPERSEGTWAWPDHRDPRTVPRVWTHPEDS